MSIQTPSYLYWLIVWHWISAVVQHFINSFIQSWCCQFYFVISLLYTVLYSCKNSTFHKTLTIKTQGGREIWIQTNFMSAQFTKELYCLVIILLLHLPYNHGNMENEYWKIRTFVYVSWHILLLQAILLKILNLVQNVLLQQLEHSSCKTLPHWIRNWMKTNPT